MTRIATLEEYTAARERLKRLRTLGDPATAPDIEALQVEVARFECALEALTHEPEPKDEHESHLGAGGAV